MEYREEDVAARELRRRALAIAGECEPMGAYASGDRVHYLFLEDGGIRSLTSAFDSADELFSLVREWPLFDWDEREMRAERGVPIGSHPAAPEPFAGDGLRARSNAQAGHGVTTIVVGPVHAGVIEPGRFTFASNGETIARLDVELSFSQRGVEEFLEGRDAATAGSRVARICGGCSASRSWAYARSLEALAGVECDEPSELTRLVFAELERAYNHVFDLASASAAAGYGKGQVAGLGLKERIMRLNARFAGHRLLFDAIVPGGVRPGSLRDPQELLREVASVRSEIERYGDDLFGNRSVARRFDGAGRVSSETARLMGATGPTRRASNGTTDLRSALPYGAYRAIVPEIARRHEGDVAARCTVKYRELLESLRCIAAALETLGRRSPDAPKPLPAAAGRVATATEGPRGAEIVCVETDARGTLVRFHAISASYRNWPLVVRAMDDNIVPDFPLVNKSFNLCYACADR